MLVIFPLFPLRVIQQNRAVLVEPLKLIQIDHMYSRCRMNVRVKCYRPRDEKWLLPSLSNRVRAAASGDTQPPPPQIKLRTQ